MRTEASHTGFAFSCAYLREAPGTEATRSHVTGSGIHPIQVPIITAALEQFVVARFANSKLKGTTLRFSSWQTSRHIITAEYCSLETVWLAML